MANTTPPVPAEAYARLFEGHGDGRVILEELVRRYARGAKIGNGIDGILETYRRDGARSVVEFILSRVNHANGAPNEHAQSNDD